MKDFGVDKIIDSVHAAIGDLDVDAIVDEVHRSVGIGRGSGMETMSGAEIEREYQVGVRPELTVSNLHSGDISVHSHDEQVVRIRVNKYGSLRALDEMPFEVTQEGSALHLRPKGRYQTSSVDYRIEVPRDCSVRLSGINPDIEVEGTSGVNVETVGGDVRVKDISGDCSIRTVSGDIAGSRLVGILNAHTTSGDTIVTESQLRRFSLHSISGDFSIETSLSLREHYLASTTSGDVRLLLSGDTGVTVLMKTFSGEVVSDLPTEVLKFSKRNWQGRINGGGAQLEMSSMSGDLFIERGAPVADEAVADVVAAEQAVAETSTEVVEEDRVAQRGDETGAVLAMLERGEISVEDAMARLEGLN